MNIPGYKIEKLIAEGGMASVYLAQQESLARPVALKLLRKFDNPAQAVRFFNEGRIIASLGHHNIITIYDLGVADERHYLAMEFLQGGDLKARINDGMTPSAALKLLETLGLCLSFVHQKGIIHRDIKPENILFRRDGTAVLTDFGVAKQMESNSSLTMDGTTFGSPHYLSPEQAACKELDGRTDIYSLGIVFYEMLTGLKAFSGDSPMEIIIAHLTSEIPFLPPHLRYCQPLLARMIAQDPADRFTSAAELVDYVHHLRATLPKRKLLKAANPRSGVDKPSNVLTQTLEEQLFVADMAPKATPDKPATGIGRMVSLLYSGFADFETPYKVAVGAGLIAIMLLTVLFWRQPVSQNTYEPRSDTQTVPLPLQVAQDIQTAIPTPQAELPPNPAIEQPAFGSPGASLQEDVTVTPAEALTPPPVVRKPVLSAKAARRQAAAILKEKNLTLSRLKQAYDLYQITLKKDPGNPESLRGINIIANKFIAIKSKSAQRAEKK